MQDPPSGRGYKTVVLGFLATGGLILAALLWSTGLRSRARADADEATHRRIERALAQIQTEAAQTPAPDAQADVSEPGPAAAASRPATNVFVNSLGMTLAQVSRGSFVMGGKRDLDLGKPDVEYRVRLDKGFWLGVHEVTRAEFRQFVQETGFVTHVEQHGDPFLIDPETGACERRKGTSLSWKDPGFVQSDDHPVTLIHAADARSFCRWLSKKEGRAYRLPGEAEWEFAARAGGTGLYAWGDRPQDGAGWANLRDRTGTRGGAGTEAFAWDDGYPCSAPVGSFKPNAWGFFDMTGNLAEWCEPWTGTDPARGLTDPPPSPKRDARTARGGSWAHGPRTSAVYGCFASSCGTMYLNAVGFRVLCEAKDP